jgi:hypothetical protein
MGDADIFLRFLEETFGEEDAILKQDCPNGGPPVSVFVYRDIPEPGMITGITYGLSWLDYPEWKASRPELIVSVESQSQAWPFAAAYFAAAYRGLKRFSYGDVFTLDTPIAEDTHMDGFLVFAQSLLESEDAVVPLNGHTVTLVQLYPIYRSELPIYNRLGLKEFWHHHGFDMFNVNRPAITG